MQLNKVLRLFEDNEIIEPFIQGIVYDGDETTYKLNLQHWDEDIDYLIDVDVILFDDGEIIFKFKQRDDEDTLDLCDPMLSAIIEVKKVWEKRQDEEVLSPKQFEDLLFRTCFENIKGE